MIDADLRARVGRLATGVRRVEDLDTIYLCLRERAHGRASVREIGDFVAHRQEREKGPVTSRVRDIFVSLESWAKGALGEVPSLPEARRVAFANLRVATDQQLKLRLGLRRSVVKSVLEQGFRKLERGLRATEREEMVVNYLVGAFIWNQVFTDSDVADDLLSVLHRNKLLDEKDREGLKGVGRFLTLYVVALMHGAAILLENGGRADLIAGFRNPEGRLEVKAALVVNSLPKALIAPVCIFWTSLPAHECCELELFAQGPLWQEPLEISENGLLRALA